MALDQAGEIGRGTEDAGQQGPNWRSSEERAERGKLGLAAAALGEFAKHALGALRVMHNRCGGDAGVEGSVGQVHLGRRLCRASAMTQYPGRDQNRVGSALRLTQPTAL